MNKTITFDFDTHKDEEGVGQVIAIFSTLIQAKSKTVTLNADISEEELSKIFSEWDCTTEILDESNFKFKVVKKGKKNKVVDVTLEEGDCV